MIDILLHNIGGGSNRNVGCQLNIFCQPTEPITKEGIWIQSPTNNQVKDVVIDDTPFVAGDYNLSMRSSMVGDLNYGAKFTRPIIYNGKIYVFGGYDNSNNYSSKLYCYDTKINKWSLLTTYQTPLAFYSVGAYNNKLYFLNGATNSSSVTSFCFVYDIATNTFSTGNATTNTVKDASFYFSETDRSLYFYGGLSASNSYIAQAGRYDLATQGTAMITTSLLNLSTLTKGSAIAVINGKMYIIGGQYASSNTWLEVTKVIDINASKFINDIEVIPQKVSKAMATVYKGEIYVFGGKIMGTESDSSLVQIYNPTTNRWRYGKSAPMPFSDTPPCVENDCAWIVTDYATMKYDFITNTWEKFFSQKNATYGVKPSVVGSKIIIPYLSTGVSEGLMYDVATNEGTMITSMPSSRTTNYASTTYNRKVYVMALGNQLAFTFDPETKTWSSLPSMLENTNGGSAVAIGDNIYYLGGATSNNRGFHKLNLINNNWTKLGSLPYPDLYSNFTCVYNDCIYAFVNNLDTAHATYKYDPKTNTWTNVAGFMYRGVYRSGVVVGSKAYLFGGGDPSNKDSMKKLIIFDFTTNTFSYGKDMPVPKMNHGVCIVGNEIYIIGGNLSYSSTPYSLTAEIYSLESKKYNNGEVVIKKTSQVNGNYGAVLYDNKNIKGVYSRLITAFDDVYLYKDNNLNVYSSYYGDGTKWVKFR